MIKHLYYIFAGDTNPYQNLALEEYLLRNVPPESCILYLWQNRHTVVIGKNQNPWQECKVGALQEDGGYLVRRLSGGGAVFHDLGNLNFTFLMPCEDYDIDKQLAVIAAAAASFGLTVEKSGRNDLTIDGRKFSGNAFCKQVNAYHHGTIMIDADLANLSKYLNVSLQKLQSNGVSSVRSRVANLKEFCPEITVEQMKKRLVEAFGQVYGDEPKLLDEKALNHEQIASYAEKYASWDWVFGKKLQFDAQIENRFPWGAVTLQFCVANGVISELAAYSDAMDCDVIYELAEVLKGCRFERQAMASALEQLFKPQEDLVFAGFDPARLSREGVVKDLSYWILSQDF